MHRQCACIVCLQIGFDAEAVCNGELPDKQKAVYRFDIDNTIALIVHHVAEELLQPLQLDTVAHRLAPVSHTQHKRYSVLKSPNLQ